MEATDGCGCEQAVTDIGLGLAGAELPEEEGDEGWWSAGVLAAVMGFLGFSCYVSHRKGRHYKCALLELSCIWLPQRPAHAALHMSKGFYATLNECLCRPLNGPLSGSAKAGDCAALASGRQPCLRAASGGLRTCCSRSCATVPLRLLSVPAVQAVPEAAGQDQAGAGGGAGGAPVHDGLLPHLPGGLQPRQPSRAARAPRCQSWGRSFSARCRTQIGFYNAPASTTLLINCQTRESQQLSRVMAYVISLALHCRQQQCRPQPVEGGL